MVLPGVDTESRQAPRVLRPRRPPPTVLRACYALSGTVIGHAYTCGATRLLCAVRYGHTARMWCYEHAIYAAMRCPGLSLRIPLYQAQYAATRAELKGVLSVHMAQVNSAICLRACYAMPGTGIVYGAIDLIACDMKCSTAVAYGVL
eukprot:1733843-Rhodomonas_salina.5